MKPETVAYVVAAILIIPGSVALINMATNRREDSVDTLIRGLEVLRASRKATEAKALNVRKAAQEDQMIVYEKTQEGKKSRVVDSMSFETYAAYRELPTVANSRRFGFREEFSSSCGYDAWGTQICVTDTRQNRRICFHYASGETRCHDDTRW